MIYVHLLMPCLFGCQCSQLESPALISLLKACFRIDLLNLISVCMSSRKYDNLCCDCAGPPGSSSSSSLPVAFLFPGQGSQSIGMISDDTAAAVPAVAQMLETANKVLGYDLMKLIREGRW